MKQYHAKRLLVLGILFLTLMGTALYAQEVLTPKDILSLKTCSNAEISPDGKWIAYRVSVPRQNDEKPGGAYSELYVVSTKTGEIIPYITGKISMSTIRWSPDGKQIGFLTRRGEIAKTQVWAIPVNGGEAYQITNSKNGVITYRWHPNGKKIAYTATTPPTKQEKTLKKKGYKFIFYEEDWKHRNLYMTCAGGVDSKYDCEPQQLTKGVTVWGFIFSPDGKTIAADISPKNLIDQRYMFRKIYLLDLESKGLTQVSQNPGKLGNYAFSPDGSKIAYCAALERKDHKTSQVLVMNTDGSGLKNLTPPNFIGHVNWVGWKNNSTILYQSGEGVWPTLSLVKATGGKREIILHAKDSGIIFSTPSFTKNFKSFAFSGNSPTLPGGIFFWQVGKELRNMTDLNPWLFEKKLGRQIVFRFNARDGQEIEGLLIYPVDYQKDQTCPLVVSVHGGPESHHSNGWKSGYSSPGQVLAGKGYAVYFPNYRASTGYGVEFALSGYEDAAGVEFDDIADGIDALIEQSIADPDRVGLGRGSYGGYASAWFSSYYTKKVKAVCMFVGISDLISKRGTSDIPYEELYVHSGKLLEDMWEESLKRSPIYYAHQSQTATLILGGADDTRVHPSQSLEFYRRMKMNNHPAVRLVQYPGEGHGNRKQPGRIDFLYRTLDWYDWYVKDLKPLDGDLPTLDISEKYGLD